MRWVEEMGRSKRCISGDKLHGPYPANLKSPEFDWKGGRRMGDGAGQDLFTARKDLDMTASTVTARTAIKHPFPSHQTNLP